jgi:flagellar biosynthesis GTPase FlhF
MSNELAKINFTIGANKETAAWVENQHNRFEKGTKLLIEVALSIGEVLSAVEISHCAKFPEWVKTNVNFHIATAYRYMSIYKYRNQISGARNITEAYKMIETLEAQKKQSETAKAYQRVNEYNKTGVKPEGWRQHTDDKLAREEAERNQRIEKLKQDALSRETEKAQEEKDREAARQGWKEEMERGRRQNEESRKHIEGAIAELGKRQEFKEKIRLSADGMNDPFQDAIIDYLDGLENDSRRIEACYNIIKICKRIANELQAEKG